MAALDHGLLKEKINKKLSIKDVNAGYVYSAYHLNSVKLAPHCIEQCGELNVRFHSALLCHQLIKGASDPINSAFALHTNYPNGGLRLRPAVLSLCVFRFWRAQA